MRLVIPIKAMPKKRPRFAGGHAYMESAYMDWKAEFGALAREQWDGEMVKGPFYSYIAFISKSGNIRPDSDNAEAAVLDALQDAGIIENDKFRKEWGGAVKKGKDGPLIVVELRALEAA